MAKKPIKHLLYTLLFIMPVLTGNSQDTVELKLKELIKKTFNTGEQNPIHLEEHNHVLQVLHNSLDKHAKGNLTAEYTPEIENLNKLIFTYGYCEYEDSPDVRRLKFRRSAGYASIALLTTYERSYTYLDYAKYSLLEDFNTIEDLLENEYLGILLIELLFEYENNGNCNYQIEQIEQFIGSNSDIIDTSTLKEFLKIKNIINTN